MTTRADIRRETVRLLVGKTIADGRVFSPMDWQTYDGEYPVVLVQAPLQDNESLGRAQTQYTATATVRIIGRLEVKAVSFDTQNLGAEAVENQLEAFEGQILRAVVNHPDLMVGLQQMSFIRVSTGYSGEGKQHLAEVVIDIGMEFYQGPEDFYPIPLVPLTDARINDPAVFTAEQLPAGLPGLEADIPLNV